MWVEEDPATFLAANTPILDVRAEAEFAQGHVQAATNIPILTDAERHQVGLCYKEQGAAAATELGHELVSGQTRDSRLQAWANYLSSEPKAVLTCWRGGQRSAIAQTWLSAAGVERPRLQGGYKRLRQVCLQTL